MKKFVIISYVIVSLLVMSFQTTDVAGNQFIAIESPNANQVPIVNSPADIIYVEGNTGHSITWEISDDNPSYWVTTRNGETLTAVSWETNNETVIVDVDGLSVGNYEFKIYAADGIHNTTDVVMVAVLSSDVEVHSPIQITNDNQFNTTAQSEGWIGNGTAIDPYIIEKLYIESSYACIRIKDTAVHFVIQNCTFVSSGTDWEFGIAMQSVTNGVIVGCTFANLWVGCVSWTVSNCIWASNSFGNLQEGIWLIQSLSCEFLGNSFMNGGISLSGYESAEWIHTIQGNTIAGKQIGYFEGLSSLDIDINDYGQVIVANCTDVDIFNGDISNAGKGIAIAHSNGSNVYNCEIQGGIYGIYLERTHDTTIDTCHIEGTTDIGLYINVTSSTTVYNCTVQNIGSVGFLGNMNTDTVIAETVIKDCAAEGIIFYNTPFLSVLNCTIQGNHDGIAIGSCPYSLIIGNIIQFNDQYGLYIQFESENTTIFNNEFLYNGHLNARDDGIDTYWDDGYSIGNIWSDYFGSGVYGISGSRNGIDHYPGMTEFIHVLEVFDTSDRSYTFGTTGHSIVWDTNATHPSMLTVFQDGIVKRQEAWDGSQIVYDIDGLAIGEYNFTLEVLGGFGETASDSVIVTVVSTIITNTTTTTTTNTTFPIGLQEITLFISIGSAAVIVIVVVLIVRSKDSPM